jgi:hypothetical protein
MPFGSAIDPLVTLRAFDLQLEGKGRCRRSNEAVTKLDSFNRPTSSGVEAAGSRNYFEMGGPLFEAAAP